MTDPERTIPYRYYCNVSGRFSYSPDDTFLLAWEGLVPDIEVWVILERLFDRFNRDDRPTGQICHSMSTGDVVVINGSAYACASFGWEPCPLPHNITTKSWQECMKDLRR